MAVIAKAGLKPGTPVTIGGVEYTCPPLNFGSIRRIRDIPVTQTYVHDLLAFIICESLRRNYDGVDAAWLNDTLEGNEIEGAGRAELEIMKASGLRTEDKEPDQGEPLAAA